VTDAENKIDEEAAPESIATHYLANVDEVIEHMRAASLLGLGVRTRSYLESDEDGEELVERWEFELLTSSPVSQEPDADADAEPE
jgi:hypothetical protein